MYRHLKLSNFKGLNDYSVSLKKMNVLVGPNNAGKSTALDAFRLLSAAMKFARRRNPTFISASHAELGWTIPANLLPISLDNIHSDYQEDIVTAAIFTLDSGAKLRLSFYESSRCILTVEECDVAVRSASQFKKSFPYEIISFPTLGPLEEDEKLLTDEYVERWRGSRLTHRMFRNIWYRDKNKFPLLKELVEQTWPGITIRPPERYGFAPPSLSMFCEESRKSRELSWAGFGFQVWLQFLTHFLEATPGSTLVIDEPEIYLHPDLQHRLFHILRDSGQQVLLATHSVEVINEADHDEVVLINKNRKSAKRIADIDGLQEALFSIGSAQNIHLAKLSRGRKILFFEGQDFKLIKRFAARCGLNSIADDVNITVVPIGGFSQRKRIEDAVWTFEQVLRADIDVAAVLDRDYRCDEEIATLLETTRSSVPRFHILDQKEIENYLLVPRAITSAAADRARERGIKEITYNDIESIIREATDEFKSDVLAQLATNRHRFISPSDSRDPTTIISESLRNEERRWATLEERLKIAPGKMLLSTLNKLLQERFRISITPPQIIRHLSADEIPHELREILVSLDLFASSNPERYNLS